MGKEQRNPSLPTERRGERKQTPPPRSGKNGRQEDYATGRRAGYSRF